MNVLIHIGGVLWVVCFVFHIFFWRLFGWNDETSVPPGINKSIIQVLNLCLMVCFAIFAVSSILHADELLTTALGRTMLAGMSIFGLLRVIEQFLFFELKHWASWAVLFGAAALSIIYSIPFISSFI